MISTKTPFPETPLYTGPVLSFFTLPMPTSSQMLARKLVGLLPFNQSNLFNPWVESCEHQAVSNTPEQRILRLGQHLDTDAKLILVGEAPGFRGARYSGVPFTSERLLMEGAIPRIQATGRLTTRETSFTEPSATIVWKALYKLGLAETTVLWNALQLHPHRPGDIWTNRTPTDIELGWGRPALAALLAHFPKAQVVAVGKKSELLLERMGLPVNACIRHPANGGGPEFNRGLEELVSG